MPKQVWLAFDGSTHDTEELAKDHEKSLLAGRVNSGASVTYTDLLAVCDNKLQKDTMEMMLIRVEQNLFLQKRDG